jgi:hypothetical protein
MVMYFLKDWLRSESRVRQLEVENDRLRDDLRIKQAIIDDMGEALARKRAFFQRLVAEAEAEGGV